ncbi:MAG: glycoside hydrolase family protein [Luminiphilus sp.]
MRMYPIDEIAASLKVEEGYRAHCYICTAGAHTVGYDRNIDADGGIGISEDEAEYLLRNDIQRTIGECQRWAWFDDLDPGRQSVVVQLCFQLGWPRLSNFNRMLTALAKQDYETAAIELLDSRFAEQVPERANRLAEKMRG